MNNRKKPSDPKSSKADQNDQDLICKETDALFNEDITDLSWGIAPIINDKNDVNIDEFFDTRIDMGDGLPLSVHDVGKHEKKENPSKESSVGDVNRKAKAGDQCTDGKTTSHAISDNIEERTNTPALEGITGKFGKIRLRDDRERTYKDMIAFYYESGSESLIADDTGSEKYWDILNKPSVWTTDICCYKQRQLNGQVKNGESPDKDADEADDDDDGEFSYETFPSDTDFTLYDNDDDKGDETEQEATDQKPNSFSRLMKNLKNSVANK